MRICRSISQDGSIGPSAANYLQQIPDNYHFVNSHARRAPVAIYNVSLGQLAADFKQVLDDYFTTKKYIIENSDQRSSGVEAPYGQLLKAQGNLVLSIQAHVDDCYSILASLVDPATSPTSSERFTGRWLRRIGFPTVDQFKRDVAPYRDDYLAHLVNGLKHRQNRLRALFFKSEQKVRLGYYLEEPDAQGIPGPSANLHEDCNSAFSFARDIRFNLYHVYYISEMLVKAVKGGLRHYHSFDLSPQKIETENEKWLDIVRLTSSIKAEVFPDEVDKPYPYVSLTEKHDDCDLVVMYPVTTIPLEDFPPGMRITSMFEGDGATKTFRLPYRKRTKYGAAR